MKTPMTTVRPEYRVVAGAVAAGCLMVGAVTIAYPAAMGEFLGIVLCALAAGFTVEALRGLRLRRRMDATTTEMSAEKGVAR